MTTGPDTISSAAKILQAQAMPAEEIRAILDADDAETVRRHLELHRERLEERLADQRRLVNDLERSLTEGSRASSDSGGDTQSVARGGPPPQSFGRR